MKYRTNDYFLTDNEMLIRLEYSVNNIYKNKVYVSRVYLTRGRRADNMHTLESMLDVYTKIDENTAKKWMRLNGHDI